MLGWGEIGPTQKWTIAINNATAPIAMPMKPIGDLLSSIILFAEYNAKVCTVQHGATDQTPEIIRVLHKCMNVSSRLLKA
jgi:hypothetical protein